MLSCCFARLLGNQMEGVLTNVEIYGRMRYKMETLVESDHRDRPDKRHPLSLPAGMQKNALGHFICGAWGKTRSSPCQKEVPAGGRCKLHRGRPPVHGLYSKFVAGKLGNVVERHELEPDPLDAQKELALLRGIMERWVVSNRDALHDAKNDPLTVSAISTASHLIDQVTKQIARIERIRAMNALSLPDLKRLIRKLAGVIERVVVDPARLEAIAEEWEAIMGEILNRRAEAVENARPAFALGEEG
jgi:hypothetical protein